MPKISERTLKQIGFAIITLAVYTAFFNWKVALLLTIGVGFHEYSHILACKYRSLKTLGFFLVPFVGGLALIGERYKTYGQQAFVALMGPVGGGLLALATAGAWYLTGYPFLAAAASWMCLLNLLNLLPLSMLDGGQLMSTITYSFNRTLGMALTMISTVIAIIGLLYLNPILAMLVIFFGGNSVIKEFFNWNNFRKGDRYLCDEHYLNPPAPMKAAGIIITIIGWATTVIVLGLVYRYFSNISEASLSTLFNK